MYRKALGLGLVVAVLVGLVATSPVGAVTDAVGGPLGFHPFGPAQVVPPTVVNPSGSIIVDVAGTDVGMHTDDVSAVVLSVNIKPRPLTYTVLLTHGWLAKPANDWRLDDESWERLLDWARKNGRPIMKAGRSSGSPRRARPPRVDPRQTKMF